MSPSRTRARRTLIETRRRQRHSTHDDRELHELRELVAARGVEIAARCTNIHNLKKELESVTAKKSHLEECIRAGTAALQDQVNQTKTLKEDNAALKEMLDQRVSVIGHQSDLILQMHAAVGNELTELALEAQAQWTLSLVVGLKSDAAEHTALIQELRRALAEKSEQVSQLERKHAKHVRVIAEKHEALVLAQQRMAEAIATSTEQLRFIESHLRTNGPNAQELRFGPKD